MLNAVVLFLLGVGASILALTAICAFISQVHQNRFERTCQMKIYFDWVMRKGSQEQKRLAQQLKHSRKLEDLKALVGYGILVDP